MKFQNKKIFIILVIFYLHILSTQGLNIRKRSNEIKQKLKHHDQLQSNNQKNQINQKTVEDPKDLKQDQQENTLTRITVPLQYESSDQVIINNNYNNKSNQKSEQDLLQQQIRQIIKQQTKNQQQFDESKLNKTKQKGQQHDIKDNNKLIFRNFTLVQGKDKNDIIIYINHLLNNSNQQSLKGFPYNQEKFNYYNSQWFYDALQSNRTIYYIDKKNSKSGYYESPCDCLENSQTPCKCSKDNNTQIIKAKTIVLPIIQPIFTVVPGLKNGKINEKCEEDSDSCQCGFDVQQNQRIKVSYAPIEISRDNFHSEKQIAFQFKELNQEINKKNQKANDKVLQNEKHETEINKPFCQCHQKCFNFQKVQVIDENQTQNQTQVNNIDLIEYDNKIVNQIKYPIHNLYEGLSS